MNIEGWAFHDGKFVVGKELEIDMNGDKVEFGLPL
jgi:hypothetical protein